MSPSMEPASERLRCGVCGAVSGPGARFCGQCGEPRAPDDAQAEANPVADPLIGRVIHDRYRIVSLLGRGGMGVVYKVEHIHIGKFMAMKLLHGELARRREIVARFRREADAVSHLNHPNTVQTFDFGRDGGLMYLVMEFLDGEDLGAVIRREGHLPFDRVARIGVQVTGSVGEAHDKGVVHRDIKPENIMILPGRDGRDIAKVLDFGLAKLRREDAGNLSLTNAGAIVGTPYYMAPEHIRGDKADPRSDVYSVGAMLYKALTGVPPFSASTPMGVLSKHLTETLPPPSRRMDGDVEVPAEADRIILRAMARDVEDRYQSMEELRADLRAYLVSIGDGEKDLTGAQHAKEVSGARPAQVATRGDVDLYERGIRRRSRLGMAFLTLLAAGLAAGAWFGYAQFNPADLENGEREPNNAVTEANSLPEGRKFAAFLGKRIDAQTADADVYRIDNPGGAPRFIRFEVSGIPNMDVVVDVVRAGVGEPMLVANAGGRGKGEMVPSFPIAGPTYYLRVREHWILDALPTENVSDPYEITWSFVTPAVDEEQEVNDTLALAGKVTLGKKLRGTIGWNDDVDTYCLADNAPLVNMAVSGVTDLDLMVTVIDGATSYSRKINEAGAGLGETVMGVTNSGESRTCFQVSAVAGEGLAEANGREPYVLSVTTP